jgi:hypothetical protein
MYSHSLQRIIDRLGLFANTLPAVGRLLFQLCNARLLALFQTLRVDGRQLLLLLLLRRRQGCDLEVLDPRDGDDVVVAGVTSSGGARVDGNDVEDRAGGEEGALERLRLGRGGGELDAGEVFGSVSCHVSYVPDDSKARQGKLVKCIRQDETYRAPIALPRASTVSTGAGVFAFGVATLAGLVVLAMAGGDKTRVSGSNHGICVLANESF